jgi:hypothetical protein
MRWTPRVLLGIGVGIAIGVLATFPLENDILAAVLGSLAALAVADAEGVVQYSVIGFVAGAGVGLFMAATGEPVAGGSLLPTGLWSVLASLLVNTIVSGLVGAVYGFIAGKLKPLYDKGRGPFF